MLRRDYINLTPKQIEIRHKIWEIIAILILIAFVFFIIWTLDASREEKPIEISETIMIQNNSIKAVAPAYFILETQVLGTLVQTTFQNDITISDLMEKIIFCESGGNPSAKNPSSTAYGLCQMTNQTFSYCQKKWDIKLNRESYADQLYSCTRLLEEEGISHFLESKSCWENL